MLNLNDPDEQLFDRLIRKAERNAAIRHKAERLMVGAHPTGEWVGGKWVEFIDPEKERRIRLMEQQKPGFSGI